MRHWLVLQTYLAGLFILGLTAPSQTWGEEKTPNQVISFVIGTPVSLGLGFEYERAVTNSNSLSLAVGGPSEMSSWIEEDGIIEVKNQFELTSLYRFYAGKKAPTGGYGILGAGFYYADTTGGDLTLVRLIGGGGYKWMPSQHYFSFSFQGGLVLGNEDEVSRMDPVTLTTETDEVGPFMIFLSLQLGVPF